ncbi:hypothetical protein BOX15_Mlig026353g1 [Macrostomum lignano]|nr:hypothetical protein BOX15_Mlig026353g1 [Macrostomum lignano]
MLAGPWVFLTVAALGLGANSLSMAVFIRERKLISSNPRLLIISQASVDLIGCVLAAIKWLTIYAPSRVPANFIGTIVRHLWFSEYVIWLTVLCSTLNLQLITLERFVALVFPLVTRSATKLKSGIAGIWIYTALHMWRVFIDLSRGDGSHSNCCVYNRAIPAWLSRSFGLVNFSMLYALPVVNMSIRYSAMIVTLRRNRSCISEESQKKKLAASSKLIKTFIVAGVAYVFCFTANQISYLLHMFDVYFDQKGLFYNARLLLVNANMIVNPVIYFVFMPPFRAALLKLCRLGAGTEGELNQAATGSTGAQQPQAQLQITRL